MTGRRPASSAPPASPPRRRPSPACSGRLRGCRRAWSCCPRSTSTCRRRNGRRSARTLPVTTSRRIEPPAIDRDPPAIPPQAAARPDGRRPRRGRSSGAGAAAATRRPARSRAIAHAMAPARLHREMAALRPADRRLTGVRALELADPAEEAQAIALALREALEEPGRTAALVTPDRDLARRVSAHLRRWGIEADDSAGRPLSQTAAGHPAARARACRRGAVRAGAAARPAQASAGDGGRRAAGLARRRAAARPGAARAAPAGRARRHRRHIWPSAEVATTVSASRRRRWWRSVAPLARAARAGVRSDGSLAGLLGALREAALALAGDAAWAGPAGRAAADLFATLEQAAVEGPERVERRSSCRPCSSGCMAAVAVRPPYGQHPRIFIWGLIEARLQHADLMILGGLNEGVWPALPAPDPWLAPRLRAELGLPSLERRIGLAAHDFAAALGARQVLVTRARRDARAPAIASRFWLRLEAMTGGAHPLAAAPQMGAGDLDRPGAYRPAPRPAPCPPTRRPQSISVTEVDRLKADPLRLLCAQDARADGARPGRRRSDRRLARQRGPPGARSLDEGGRLRSGQAARRAPRRCWREAAAHPLMRALWQPRLIEAIDFIADRVETEPGRGPAAAGGRDRRAMRARRGQARRQLPTGSTGCADGSLAIVDYKTGQPPSAQGGRGRLFAAARPARPDRRAWRLRRASRASPPASNIGRWRDKAGPARLCRQPGRRPQRARRGRFHRPSPRAISSPPRSDG